MGNISKRRFLSAEILTVGCRSVHVHLLSSQDVAGVLPCGLIPGNLNVKGGR